MDTSFGYNMPPPSPPPQKRRRRGLLALIIVLLLVAVGGGGAYAWTALRPADPTQLFETALANALSTKSYTQQDSDDLLGSIGLKVDSSDVKKLTFAGTLEYEPLGIAMSGYRTPQSSYFRIDRADEESLRPVLNKWVQAPEEGREAYEGFTFVEAFKPQYVMSSQYIIGNFSESDRQTLLDIIRNEQVYSYDPEQSVVAEVDNQEVRSYQVKVKGSALRALNEKALQIAGLDSADDSTDEGTALAIELIEQDADVVMHIATGSKRLVKIETALDGQKTSAAYSDYDTTEVGTEPKAALEWDAYLKLVSAESQDQALSDKAKDNQRRVDINALAANAEAYYAENGYYPSLKDYNDAAWRQANLPGLSSDTLKDPSGTAQQLGNQPAPNVYSYQVGTTKALEGCGIADCRYYKFTATLSDGSLYVKSAF